MAMQAENSGGVLPSAQVVGNAFVEQYYHILHQSPELVHKFYQDSSILSRPDANGQMSSVTTMQAIDEKIQSLDYKNCKAEIKTADAQDSHQSGVIVLVTGCLTGKDNVKRKFAQTFFLAPQEKGYFVQNDVFRFVEESAPPEKTSTPVDDIVDSAPKDLAVQTSEVTHVSDDNPKNETAHNLAADDLNTRPEICDAEDKEGSGSGLEEEVVDEPAPVQISPNETGHIQKPDSSATPEEKKSYASIVRVTKISGSSGHGQTGSLRWAPAKTDQHKSRPAKPSPEPETLVSVVVNGPDSNHVNDDEGHSIYVRNLPMNATVAHLEEEFKKFGPIKSNGIQVRSNKQQGFCFGFVEFESLDSMHSAIKAPSITIGNRQVVVEEKRTTTRVGSSGGGRGRYSSGRGGGGFRGRGGHFGGRSFGRNEFKYQGEFPNRSKGPTARNLEVYQRVDQNNGGRYPRQPNKDTNSAQ
ncbi:hypothetical protein M8C21_025294 [Ambrosia artemisiifolia]|uniref:Uncharacterized protein n=1 Tax=Ambrosia artemisiifolia TaxID=4212 RepID=A0AAD5C1U0_AMBAR|nr:hypothetical protein M8C21_025294 [Ambrosia artemisiifolia]